MRKLYTGNGRIFDSRLVETHYCPASDMTFITYEVGTETEVVGFYFGEPSEINTEEYIGKLVAKYDYSEEEQQMPLLKIPGVIFSSYLTDEDDETENHYRTEAYHSKINGEDVSIYLDIFEDDSVMLQVINADCDNIVPMKPFPTVTEATDYIKSLLVGLNL